MLAVLQAIILGIVEGLTEFLPISSTGHLIIAEDLMGYKDTAKVFTVVVQLGAIAAVVWFYRSDLVKRIKQLGGKQKNLQFWKNLFVASLPAVVIGLFAENAITENAITLVVAVALIVGGIALLLAEKHIKTRQHNSTLQVDSITTRQAFSVGLAQVLSLVPGVSRSGATIVGGMYAGLNRVTAAAFSFYLSIPIIIGASGYKLLKNKDALQQIDGGLAALLCGTLAAFVSALFVVTWLLKYIAKHDFTVFGYYRIVLGVLLLVLLGVNVL